MKKIVQSIIILLFTTTIFSQNKIQMSSQSEASKQIEQTVKDLFRFTDEREWDKVENIFAPEVLLDYTSMAGGEPNRLSPQQITDSWKGILPGFDYTHHAVSSFQIDQEGKTAKVQHFGNAVHFLAGRSGEARWIVIGNYEHHLSLLDGRWRVDKMKFNLKEMSGNMDLPRFAQERVQGKLTPSATIANRNKATVKQFFSLLSEENIPAFIDLFAEDGKQVNPYASGLFPEGAVGKKALSAYWTPVPGNFDGMEFPIEALYALEDPSIIFVKYTGKIKLKNNAGFYQNDYYSTFTFDAAGKITEYVEIFNPIVAAAGFGMLDQIKETSITNSSKEHKMTSEKVSFKSQGVDLIGDLYYPENYSKDKQYPTIIVSGSWTTVKEQMAGLYAQKFAEEGFLSLAFDFRNFGESGGEPRFFESPALKAQDIISAVDFVEGLPAVDKNAITAFGVCAGAMYTLMAASEDSRISKVVTAASWLHDAEAVKLFYGGEEGVQQKIQAAQAAKSKYKATGTVDYIPTISEIDEAAAMYGPYDYYLNPERGAIKEWSNDKFAVMSWEDWLTTDPTVTAEKITVPILMIHSDGAVLPDYTKAYFKRIGSAEKELHWMPTELDSPFHQFSYYDQDAEVNEVIERASAWFQNQ